MNKINFDKIFKQTIYDIKVKTTEEFDRNFERKAFFNKPWKPAKIPNSQGSLMMRTSTLRLSINSRVKGQTITFSTSVPYASFHNTGVDITVTRQMQKYFWAMYSKTKPPTTSTGKKSNSKKARLINSQAQMYKALALKKVGSKIHIPQRQFIGSHPQITTHIQNILNHNLKNISFEK